MHLPILSKSEKLIFFTTIFVLFISIILGSFLSVKDEKKQIPEVDLATESPRPLSLPSLTVTSQPVANVPAPTNVDSGIVREVKKEDPPTLFYTTDTGDKSLTLMGKKTFFILYNQQGKTEKKLSLAEIDNKDLVEKFIRISQIDNFVTVNVYPDDTQKTQVYYFWRK